MANISVYLEKILTAIYGEEVRGSIHDALAAMNEEAGEAYSVAVSSQESAKNYAATAGNFADNAARDAESAANSAELTRGVVATAQSFANNAAEHANTARGYLNAAKEEVFKAEKQADNAKRSALDASDSENNSKLYMKNTLDAKTQAVQLVESLEKYIVVMEQFAEFVMDYEIDLPIQDSDGDAILDSNGEEVTSYVNGFKAFTNSVVELQKIVARHTGEIRQLQEQVSP